MGGRAIKEMEVVHAIGEGPGKNTVGLKNLNTSFGNLACTFETIININVGQPFSSFSWPGGCYLLC